MIVDFGTGKGIIEQDVFSALRHAGMYKACDVHVCSAGKSKCLYVIKCVAGMDIGVSEVIWSGVGYILYI